MSLSSALTFLAVATASLVTRTAHAGLQTCHFDGTGSDGQNVYDVRRVEYFSATSFNPTAWRCDANNGQCSLSGYVISKHHTAAGQPAIVFLHGSEGGAPGFQPVADDQSLTVYSCPIKRFVDNGYVVFMPFRRGVVDQTDPSMLPVNADTHRTAQTGWSNTGWAANAWAIHQVQQQGVAMNIDNYDGQYITYLDMEIDDLIPAINRLDNFVRPDMTANLVDPTRIAIVGHSIGGAMATFASSDDDLYDPSNIPHGPRAFVSLSGAAMSYHESHWWHDVLTGAAAINNAPLVFTRVLDEDARTPNDFASAQEPFAARGAFPQKSGMALFSPVNATCSASVSPWQCAHTAFVTNSAQIDRWFPFVNDTLHIDGM